MSRLKCSSSRSISEVQDLASTDLSDTSSNCTLPCASKLSELSRLECYSLEVIPIARAGIVYQKWWRETSKEEIQIYDLHHNYAGRLPRSTNIEQNIVKAVEWQDTLEWKKKKANTRCPLDIHDQKWSPSQQDADNSNIPRKHQLCWTSPAGATWTPIANSLKHSLLKPEKGK